MTKKNSFPPDDLTIFMEKYPEIKDFPESALTRIVKNEIAMRKRNKIHATAIIGAFVEMGEGNVIGANTIIEGRTKIGSGNQISSNAVIGTPPEHKDYWNNRLNAGVVIGDKCVIREFTTINAGIELPTTLEDEVIMLRGSHVGHDSKIMRNATLSCNVLIGGHSLIGIFTNFGLGAVCHQFTRIGHYSIVGMNSTLTKSVGKLQNTSFLKFAGTPAKVLAPNTYWTDYLDTKDIEGICEQFKQEVWQ